ncbi:hypothetical protein ABIG06_000813 [Bradyrhizobium sp. USDA 326]|uniref:hypothetical protein n=1 Tax=unclassified Bradyrhizobium TaxID=2631580 RepID=UPI003518DF8F
MSADLRAEYKSEISRGKLEISVNRDSLEAFLQQSETVHAVVNRCIERGISIDLDVDRPDTAFDYLISSLAASGIHNLSQFEERLRNVSESNIDDLQAINSRGAFGFGIFTPLRVLMISQLDAENRRRVVDRVPSGGAVGNAERAHFCGED